MWWVILEHEHKMRVKWLCLPNTLLHTACFKCAKLLTFYQKFYLLQQFFCLLVNVCSQNRKTLLSWASYYATLIAKRLSCEIKIKISKHCSAALQHLKVYRTTVNCSSGFCVNDDECPQCTVHSARSFHRSSITSICTIMLPDVVVVVSSAGLHALIKCTELCTEQG